MFVAGQGVENRDVSASAVQASRCDPEDVSEKQGYQGLGVISDESESRVTADRNDAELRGPTCSCDAAASSEIKGD